MEKISAYFFDDGEFNFYIGDSRNRDAMIENAKQALDAAINGTLEYGDETLDIVVTRKEMTVEEIENLPEL